MDKPEHELGVELAEALFDSTLNDGLLKDIPVIGSLLNLSRLTKSIPDRIFAAKVRAFLFTFERVSELQKEKFLTEMVSDSARRKKLSEILVFSLNKIDDSEKAEYAYAFMAYIESAVSFEEFRRLLHSIGDAFVTDLDDFITFQSRPPHYLPSRLRGLTTGTLALNSGASRTGEGISPVATELGNKFREIVLLYRKRCI